MIKDFTVNGVKCVLNFSYKSKSKEWPCYVWHLLIDNELFTYSTGLAHATTIRSIHASWTKKPDNKECFNDGESWVHIPQVNDILECLFSDAECGNETFTAFCYNLGYNDDSIKHFKVYMACQDTATRLRKAFGKEYESVRMMIEKQRESA